MKTVIITEAIELGGKRYFAGEAVVSDAEATALVAADALDDDPEDYVVPATEQAALLENIPQPHVAPFGATTAVTAVPGSFADEAAVQIYLATAIPIIETRLDNLEAKQNATLDQLEEAGIFEPA